MISRYILVHHLQAVGHKKEAKAALDQTVYKRTILLTQQEGMLELSVMEILQIIGQI